MGAQKSSKATERSKRLNRNGKVRIHGKHIGNIPSIIPILSGGSCGPNWLNQLSDVRRSLIPGGNGRNRADYLASGLIK